MTSTREINVMGSKAESASMICDKISNKLPFRSAPQASFAHSCLQLCGSAELRFRHEVRRWQSAAVMEVEEVLSSPVFIYSSIGSHGLEVQIQKLCDAVLESLGAQAR